MLRLVLWVVFWGAATVVVGSQVLRQPVFFLAVAVGLCFLFVLVNGISLGISDWNPISSAFVLTVFILAALGLRDPGVGLLCASILLIACSEGGDMQQDRSTGWRLGTNRVVQFRYQVIGIAMGAVLAVVLAKVFMNAYPVLRVDQFGHPHAEGAQQWQSAMTYKFVGALQGITNPQPHVMKALRLGILLGLLIEIARKLIKRNRALPASREDLPRGARRRFRPRRRCCCPARTPRRSAGSWSCPRCSGGRQAAWGRRCSTWSRPSSPRAARSRRTGSCRPT